MKKNIKFIFCIIMVFLIFLGLSPNINAEINSNYAQDSIVINESGSDDTGFLTSLLLEILGIAIYALAWVVEKLVAGVVWLLTKNFKFPWADMSIFNGMAILDVNFINPANGSLFKDSSGFTTIGISIRNIYFTGLSIALGFLGIVIAVMAIRLAISSIGSEKAKYKEAIIHWITALVLLFGMHYLISLVFYLNEQLTEVASNIVFEQMNNVDLAVLGNSNMTNSSGAISKMGEYFKNEAIKLVDNFGMTVFTSAILYAVFIVQSVMFFWAYLKRFFYVTILALLAPFVVVYDFMRKSI